jgi:hypothetical protein
MQFSFLKIKVKVNDALPPNVKFAGAGIETIIRNHKMSSHHFVREGQEPALFILDHTPFQFAQSLLEWVPLVMVADSALEDVLQWRIKIDVVLQQQYSNQTIEDLIKDQGPVETLFSANDSTIRRGFQYLADNGYEAVNLLSAPHDAIFQEVEQSAHTLQVGIYSEEEKWSLISTGKFEKWMPTDAALLIRSTSPVQTEGIVQNGQHWQTSGPGIVTVRSEALFWIGERP